MVFRPAGLVADVPEGGSRSIWIGILKIAVFRIDGRLYACRNRCPHMGADLSDGRPSGTTITCSWHNWSFDLESGQCLKKDWARLETYRVRIAGDRFEIEVPADRP